MNTTIPPSRSSSRARNSKPTNSGSMKPDEDWRNVPDSAERRKIQNRIAQRSYRSAMRARKHEIEELKQQLQRYSSKESNNKSISVSSYTNHPDVDSNTRDESQSTSLRSDPPRSSVGDVQADIAVLNRGANASTFTPTSHLQTDSDGQLNPDSSIDLSPLYGAPSAHAHSLPIIHGDSNTIPLQNGPLTPHSDMSTHIAVSDQPWNVSLWSPARELDTPKAQHREWAMSPTSTCTCPTPGTPKTRHHASILHLSIASGSCDIVKMLLQADDIDIDEEDNQGYTPLQRAVMAGRADMVAILLEHGADINNSRD